MSVRLPYSRCRGYYKTNQIPKGRRDNPTPQLTIIVERKCSSFHCEICDCKFSLIDMVDKANGKNKHELNESFNSFFSCTIGYRVFKQTW